jgi:hypothetical protein
MLRLSPCSSKLLGKNGRRIKVWVAPKRLAITIEAEREHKCEKTQVSPALPDTMEGGRGARGRLNMLGISKVRRERHSLKPELARTMSTRAVSAVILSFAAISTASTQAPRGELCVVGRV